MANDVFFLGDFESSSLRDNFFPSQLVQTIDLSRTRMLLADLNPLHEIEDSLAQRRVRYVQTGRKVRDIAFLFCLLQAIV